MGRRRIIFHIDVNSAFLSWEAADRLKKDPDALDLRTVPSAVGGDAKSRHGVVLAKSTPARQFGVTTGEPLASAFRKCPELAVSPARFDLYLKCSHDLFALLGDYTPDIEKFSIDEAFLDMSETIHLFGPPIETAGRIRRQIRRELGFSVNIGISSNKLLAKMASDFEKPDKTHTLFPEEIPAKMWPLPVRELFFVGKSTEKKLRTLGIRTIGDLAACDPALLSSHFHKQGLTIWNYANGRDLESVTGHDSANKGYSSETTLAADMTDPETAKIILLSLAETVAARIRADKAYISVVGVTLVTCEFEKYSHQKSLFSPTNITEEIYHTAVELFAQMWKKEPIRLIGLSTSKATSDQTYQYDLFHKDQYERLSKLNSALDSIRDKYGSGAVKRACFLKEED